MTAVDTGRGYHRPCMCGEGETKEMCRSSIFRVWEIGVVEFGRRGDLSQALGMQGLMWRQRRATIRRCWPGQESCQFPDDPNTEYVSPGTDESVGFGVKRARALEPA